MLISDSDERVRISLAGALGKLGDERGLEPLRTLMADSAEDVRFFAAVALARFGCEDAGSALVEFLNHPDSLFAEGAVEALAKLAADQVVTE